ncbi:MAG: helix-turn-helix domain-containing protein [Clostridia bacterium]|nr:helix-turn-helix domain-containing protein [Clostridia bacterium]
MAGRTTLKLTEKDKAYLKKITRRRSMEARAVSRAKILLHKAEGYTIDEIAQLMKIHRNTVILCLKKYNEGGIEYALNDKPRKSMGRGHGVSAEARDWVISVASREPQYAGFLDSSWSYEGLTSYLSKNAEKFGFPELENVSKTTVRRILSTADNSTLKIRRNDLSQHRHDGDVQLSIAFDDILSSGSDWENHGPGEQLSMSMMFDLCASDFAGEPDETPESEDDLDDIDLALDEAEEAEEALEDEDIALDEDIAEDDALEDDIQEQEPILEEPAAENLAAAEDPVAAEEPVPDAEPAAEPAEDTPAEEPAAEPANDSIPESVPETEPVEEHTEEPTEE